MSMFEDIAVARINKDVNGIELTFPGGKPEYEVLRALRENHFRWHNKKKVWYARNTVDNVRAVERFVNLDRSDKDFGITPNGTVDIQILRNERLNISLDQGGLQTSMKAWYFSKYPEDDGARELDWRGVGTFKDLFDALDRQENVYHAYPEDSVVRERLFAELAGRLGCDYGVIYDQWLGSRVQIGKLTQLFGESPASGARDQGPGAREGVSEFTNSETITEKEHELGYDLGFGHKGNGIVVWNRLQEEHGDYKRVAHISADRVVTYYDKNMPDGVKQRIRSFAAKEDPTISATQSGKVFKNRPDQDMNEIGAGMAPGTGSTKGKSVLDGGDDVKKAGARDACLADFYDKVGTGEIYRDSTVEGALWSPAWGQCYYEDLNARISVKLDSAQVIELDNAMKRGKTCKVYSIYTGGQDMRLYLANECGVRSPKDLYDLVRSGKELPGSGRLSVREDKGVEVFSPFVSVKPLKGLPEKWKKADLVRAIMCGQVYSGTWKERLTDDYAYDAARGFLNGLKVDLPEQAEDLVEGCDGPCINTKSVDAKGIATVYYSYANETKTFLFDVNCDLAQSMERQKAADRAVLEHNDKIKASIVKVSEKDIDDGKVYVVDRVVENDNTGVLGVAPEILQGFVLKELLDFGGTVGGITGVKEAELVPGRLYEVADFFQRRDYAEPDERIVDMGNWKQLASGKAVAELTREGVLLKMSIGGYERPHSFVQAKRVCEQHLEGKRFWGPGVCEVDYAQSLEKLENEEARIARDRLRVQPSLESLIADADRSRVAHNDCVPFVHRDNER